MRETMNWLSWIYWSLYKFHRHHPRERERRGGGREEGGRKEREGRGRKEEEEEEEEEVEEEEEEEEVEEEEEEEEVEEEEEEEEEEDGRRLWQEQSKSYNIIYRYEYQVIVLKVLFHALSARGPCNVIFWILSLQIQTRSQNAILKCHVYSTRDVWYVWYIIICVLFGTQTLDTHWSSVHYFGCVHWGHAIALFKMLQNWASEGEFCIYRWFCEFCTGGFVLHQFIEPVTFAHCAMTSLYWTWMSRLRLRVACGPPPQGHIDVHLYIHTPTQLHRSPHYYLSKDFIQDFSRGGGGNISKIVK